MADELLCSCHRLRRTSRAVTRLYEQALDGSGITITQYSVLSILARRGPSTATEIARSIGADRTTMTRTLDRMIKAKLIRETTAEDGREHPVLLAPAGEEAMTRAVKGWRRAEGTLNRALGPDRVGELWRLLSEAETAAAI
ncbi:MarR family transcriptional regulator [Rhizobiales bacterium]|uniref:MarR family winged helix-turn-helix transcriptional regulator n=1 Tax=Hongsoonwoonella zoysiae TaxID=2821844 RepID=UPI0015603FC9|nr:MarR family transcriptional regulator [Hongsoonwoonella zoysiae]NRG19735.1 MarR family transcriptional regulator [Hongsoonwoonella zoysiae]